MADANQLDKFYHKAKKEGFVARSIYKLRELDQKLRWIKPGQKILDLGCAPGSWIQYCDDILKGNGLIVGIDIAEVRVPEKEYIHFFQENLYQVNAEKLLKTFGQFDIVLSDAAPKTVGYTLLDHEASYTLCMQNYEIASTVLKKGGNFLCKMYQGGRSPEFMKMMRQDYKIVKTQKPVSSKSHSNEVYFVGAGKLFSK